MDLRPSGVIFHRASEVSFFSPSTQISLAASNRIRSRDSAGRRSNLGKRGLATPLGGVARAHHSAMDGRNAWVRFSKTFAASYDASVRTPCSAFHVAPSFFPSTQSSLVMGSPFIKMIFSLLNCAADKGWVGMAEVDGAVISGAPF